MAKTRVANVKMDTTVTQAFHLSTSIVPATATEVLLFVYVDVGTSTDKISDVEIYTLQNGVHYAKYISLHTYNQNAWSTNTDNIWPPLFTSKTIYVKSPNAHYGNVRFYISVIGYR